MDVCTIKIIVAVIVISVLAGIGIYLYYLFNKEKKDGEKKDGGKKEKFIVANNISGKLQLI